MVFSIVLCVCEGGSDVLRVLCFRVVLCVCVSVLHHGCLDWFCVCVCVFRCPSCCFMCSRCFVFVFVLHHGFLDWYVCVRVCVFLRVLCFRFVLCVCLGFAPLFSRLFLCVCVCVRERLSACVMFSRCLVCVSVLHHDVLD